MHYNLIGKSVHKTVYFWEEWISLSTSKPVQNFTALIMLKITIKMNQLGDWLTPKITVYGWENIEATKHYKHH